jgi:hypothetical protein
VGFWTPVLCDGGVETRMGHAWWYFVSLAEQVSFHPMLDYIAIVLGESYGLRIPGISPVAQRH